MNTRFNLNMDRMSENLDKYLASLGCIISIILILFLLVTAKRPLYIITGILIFISCLIWLIIRDNASIKYSYKLEEKQYFYIFNIMFIILLICSIITIYLRPEMYTRPIEYFLFIIALIGIITLEIFTLEVNRRNVLVILIQIIILGLNLDFSQLLIFPSLVGIDPWWHQFFTYNIINSGYIPENNLYSKIPIFHLGIANMALITGLDYKLSSMFIWSTFQVLIDAIFIYLLSRYLFNDRIAILSSLLVIISNHHISMGFWLIPTTIGAALIPIIIYLLFKMRSSKAIAISILFMIILILTHTIVSAALALILLMGWIAFKLYSYINASNKFNNYITWGIFILFTSAMLGWWMYASGTAFTKLGQLLSWGFSIDYFISTPLNIMEYQLNIPFLELLFNNLGMFLFFSLALIGFFYMISKKRTNSYRFAIAVMSMSVLAIAFLSLLTGRSIVEHRWYYIAEILLSIPLSLTFFIFVNTIKDKKLKIIIPTTLILFLSFLMIMNPLSNIDNHIFSPHSGVTYSFKTSEIDAAIFFSEKSAKEISSDSFFIDEIFTHYYNVSPKITESNYFDKSLSEKEFVKRNQTLLLRKEITENPFRLFGATYKLDYNPEKILDDEYNRIYDCDSTRGYV